MGRIEVTYNNSEGKWQAKDLGKNYVVGMFDTRKKAKKKAEGYAQKVVDSVGHYVYVTVYSKAGTYQGDTRINPSYST